MEHLLSEVNSIVIPNGLQTPGDDPPRFPSVAVEGHSFVLRTSSFVVMRM